jgi:hypothetical protein
MWLAVATGGSGVLSSTRWASGGYVEPNENVSQGILGERLVLG